ncbi:MAG: CBS domain-containing protein [Bacteroidetes bacterium]|nr:MAG: CBS domain-containing protein [Bacteroidota bacterium]
MPSKKRRPLFRFFTSKKHIAMIDRTLPVAQLMTTDVVFVKPDDVLTKVDELFRAHNIHHLPVIDEEGKVVGIISKTDFYRLQHGMTLFKATDAEAFNQALFRSLLVKEVMTKQVAKLHPDDTIEIAAGIFRENLFHAMPVVDKDNKLVGILTTYDLLNYAFREPALLDK